MGWNDHVDMVETECLNCGHVAVWEIWNDTAKVRYGGDLGRKLSHDIRKSGCCPECGSTRGKEVDDS